MVRCWSDSKPMLSVIIVTHNSEKLIGRCIESLDQQSLAAARIIIVDSGSDSPSYLDVYSEKAGYEVHLKDNIGFAAANNFGLKHIADADKYVCLMNPDTFLEPESFKRSVEIVSGRPGVAVLTGRLKGFDLNSGRPNGLLDSTGIFRTWYGRWYDRGQGLKNDDKYLIEEEVPAVCGAFMFCKVEALSKNTPDVFDESFFMYKEDIDLCLRLRKQGWKMLYAPAVEAFHARGWSQNRKEISYQTRCLASKNEIRMNLKHRSPYLIWALSKYFAVRLLHV